MFDEMKKMVDDFTKEADEFIARYKARAEELEIMSKNQSDECKKANPPCPILGESYDDWVKRTEFYREYRKDKDTKIGNSDNSREWPQKGDEYWYLSSDGYVYRTSLGYDPDEDSGELRIGNIFKTKREAAVAALKLQAWKRLKDAGISFDLPYLDGPIYFGYDNSYDGIEKDMKLLFGGDDE